MARGPRRMAKARAAEATSGAAAGAVAEQAATLQEAATEAAAEPVAPAKKKGTLKKRKRCRAEDSEDEDVTKNPQRCADTLDAWASNSSRLDRWLASRGGGLEQPLVDASGGIVRLRDYLPSEIADATLGILENLPEDVWELSDHKDDDGAAKHQFWSADVCDVPQLAPLRSVLWRMLKTFNGEPTLPIFSCGRYGSTDHIERHDDRAHVPFFGGGQMYSRTVAGIWHLTRDWTAEDGGCLIDLQAPEGSQQLVPIYNSFVAFEVPHWHAVSPVTSGRYRYSIFGWWHQQGERYSLPGGMPSAAGESAGKRKLKKKKTSSVTTTDAGAERCEARRDAVATEDAAAQGQKLTKVKKVKRRRLTE